MHLTLSDEQVLLRDMATRFVAEEYDFESRRRFSQSAEGFSREIWQQFAELGWLLLPISEEGGGLGGSEVDIGIIMEALGRGLVIEPFVSTAVLGAGLVDLLGTEAQKADLLTRVGEGTLLLAFAHVEPQARYDLENVESRAVRDGNGYRVSGTKDFVLGGPSADILLVSARFEEGGIGVFAIPADAEGIERVDFPTLDGARASNITFTEVKVSGDALLGDVADATAAIRAVVDRAIVAICWESVGCMRALLDATVEYTKTRVQFGRPLSANQVLRHRMVEMMISVEEASASALRTSLISPEDGTARALAVSSVKNKAGRSGRFVSEQAVQLHGGMGVTEELNVGSFFKKLLAIETLFGSPEYHLEKHMLLSRAA